MSNFTLPDMSLEGGWFVDYDAVDIEQLLHARPGSIIVCKHLHAVQYIPGPLDTYDRIAGLISDAA